MAVVVVLEEMATEPETISSVVLMVVVELMEDATETVGRQREHDS
jgi:hypothetical protein